MIAQCIRDRVLSGEPMTQICEAVGIGRTTVHRWKQDHPEFRDMIRPTVELEAMPAPGLEPPEDAPEPIPPHPTAWKMGSYTSTSCARFRRR